MKKKAKGLKSSSRRKEDDKNDTKSLPPLGNGIAALTAEAALKSSKKQQDRETQSIQHTEGIAALAAQAALKKNNQDKETVDAPAEERLPAGGIAALAAQAALKKNNQAKQDDDSGKSTDGGTDKVSYPSEFQMSKLEKEAAANDNINSLPVDDTLEKQPSLGEMAELAAKAAVEISKMQAIKNETSQQTTIDEERELTDQDSTRKLEVQRAKESVSDTTHESPPAVMHAKSGKCEKLDDTLPKPLAVALSSLELPVVSDSTSKRSPQNGVPLVSSTDKISSPVDKNTVENPVNESLQNITPGTATQVALEKNSKQNQSPRGEMSSLATQVALDKTPDHSPKKERGHHSPIGTLSSPTAQVAPEKTPEQSPDESVSKASPTPAVSSLATRIRPEKNQNQSPQDKTSYHSPTGASSSLAAKDGREKASKQSPEDKSPALASEKTSLTAQIFAEKTRTLSPVPRTPQRSPAAARSSLSLALENVNVPSPKNISSLHSPTSLMSSLVMALENAKRKERSKSKSPSLGSFLEKQDQKVVSRQEVRNEILRQNHDDSSVAMMAENLQKDQIHGDAWNQGGGIADYMGWANQAIKASDTDSVRDFQTARDMVYDDQSTIATNMDDSTHATNMDDSTHATNFDDGTIATNFDDDASIGTAMTPRNDLGYSGGGQEYYSSEQYDNYIGSANDPYNNTMATDGFQNPYGDAVINMPLEFTQDQGLSNGLSFGDEGFDGPGEYGTNAMMVDAGGYGDGLVGFGQDAGLGGFGMASPAPHGNTLNSDFNHTPIPGPPLAGGNANLNLPWGATPTNQPNGSNEDRNRAWSAGPGRSQKAQTGDTPPKDEGVVFRGWGDAPKTPEQPKRKNWFWN